MKQYTKLLHGMLIDCNHNYLVHLYNLWQVLTELPLTVWFSDASIKSLQPSLFWTEPQSDYQWLPSVCEALSGVSGTGDCSLD